MIEDEATLSPKWAADAHFGACDDQKASAPYLTLLPNVRRR
jgi:hypothetical protein